MLTSGQLCSSLQGSYAEPLQKFAASGPLGGEPSHAARLEPKAINDASSRQRGNDRMPASYAAYCGQVELSPAVQVVVQTENPDAMNR